MKGWVKLNRSIQEHWLWQEKRTYSKAEAWIDLLMNANHQEKKVLIKNNLIVVKRGQLIMSLKTLSERWGWSIKKVRTFIELLKNDSMLGTEGVTVTTRLTILNYDDYQTQGHERGTNEDVERAQVGQAGGNKQECKEGLEGKKGKKPSKRRKVEYTEEFEKFWKYYDKNSGSKENTFKKWEAIDEDEKELIRKHLPSYINSTPEKKWRMNAINYLKGECWNNEIISNKEIQPEVKKPVINRNMPML